MDEVGRGEDFRTEFSHLDSLQAIFPGRVVVAMTATASRSMIVDLRLKLAQTMGGDLKSKPGEYLSGEGNQRCIKFREQIL